MTDKQLNNKCKDALSLCSPKTATKILILLCRYANTLPGGTDDTVDEVNAELSVMGIDIRTGDIR